MTETSLFWGGLTIGDHGTYTDDQFSDFIKRICQKVLTTEGVMLGHGSELACTNPSGSTIRIASGYALVDGKLYENTANVDHTVTAPGTGTNYYTIVLRKDFAAQTVRQVLLGPSSVAYPAVTQVDGTTWEIQIARVSITSASVITVTDVRVYCHFAGQVSTDMLENLAVTAAKLASDAVTTDKILDGSVTPDKLSTTVRTDGWEIVSDAWSYASATTINVPAGATSIYQKGDKWKLTANGVVLQGYIVNVASTLLTVRGDALTNHVFSSIYFSHQLNPLGFPQWFNWTPTLNAGDADLPSYTQARFCIVGKTVHVMFTADNKTVSGSTGSIKVSLPVNSAYPISWFGSVCVFYTSAYHNIRVELLVDYFEIFKDITTGTYASGDSGYWRITGEYEY
jgi:hypothetical protein